MEKKCLFAILLLIMSCSPKVRQTIYKKTASLKDFERVVVFSKMDSTVLKKGIVVGDIVIKDGGLTINCDLETITGIAKSKAKLLGANVLMIYEHKFPNPVTSSCHRIKAKAIRIEDISVFEEEIVWHKDRKLKISDFKGNKEKRPSEAATSSSFRYSVSSSGLKRTAIFSAEAVFRCNDSYFKMSDDSSFVLSHEQLHFDITEFYTRLFVSQVKNESFTMEDFRPKIEKIANQIISKIQLENDHYDSEVYKDYSRQSLWNAKIAGKLDSLAEFASGKVEIRYVKKR